MAALNAERIRAGFPGVRVVSLEYEARKAYRPDYFYAEDATAEIPSFTNVRVCLFVFIVVVETHCGNSTNKLVDLCGISPVTSVSSSMTDILVKQKKRGAANTIRMVSSVPPPPRKKQKTLRIKVCHRL